MAGVAVAADAAGERFEVEFQVADGSWQREPLSSCHGTRFEDALPARPFRFEKGLQSFAGWWYFATTGTHVGFESWLERDHLMLMDFDPGVRAVASQPFWFRWRDEDDHVRRHAPDFFARRHDGRAVVVDVRPDDRIPERDEQKFAVTAEACEAAGWDYLRSGDLDPGDGRERAVAVALPAPAVPGAGGRRGPAGGFRRVLSVDRGEEPQQAETSKTRA